MAICQRRAWGGTSINPGDDLVVTNMSYWIIVPLSMAVQCAVLAALRRVRRQGCPVSGLQVAVLPSIPFGGLTDSIVISLRSHCLAGTWRMN